jgi:hypothetical protein
MCVNTEEKMEKPKPYPCKIRRASDTGVAVPTRWKKGNP